MNRIYQIRLKDIDLDTEDDFSHPFFTDIALLLNDDYKNIGFSDDESMFFRISEPTLYEVERVINKYTTFTKEDVSERVISGEIQKLYPEVEELTPMLFENFRLDMTNIDTILDKISSNGIESLDSTDITILKKEST